MKITSLPKERPELPQSALREQLLRHQPELRASRQTRQPELRVLLLLRAPESLRVPLPELQLPVLLNIASNH